jgi:hypothetical protein
MSQLIQIQSASPRPIVIIKIFQPKGIIGIASTCTNYYSGDPSVITKKTKGIQVIKY